jgi:hypothetical protein
MNRKLAIVLAAVAAAFLVIWAAGARAQSLEPHAWIMDDDRYKRDPDSNGHRAGCCGTSHCQPAQPGDLVRRPDGSVLHVPSGTSLPAGSKAVYLTADPKRRAYACVVDRKLVCAALKGDG